MAFEARTYWLLHGIFLAKSAATTSGSTRFRSITKTATKKGQYGTTCALSAASKHTSPGQKVNADADEMMSDARRSENLTLAARVQAALHQGEPPGSPLFFHAGLFRTRTCREWPGAGRIQSRLNTGGCRRRRRCLCYRFCYWLAGCFFHRCLHCGFRCRFCCRLCDRFLNCRFDDRFFNSDLGSNLLHRCLSRRLRC